MSYFYQVTTILLLLGAGAIWIGPQVTKVTYDPIRAGESTSLAQAESPFEEAAPVATKDEREVVTHVPLPEQVKAIYMTSCVAGTPSFRDDLVELMKETEINSVMIDVKDYSGTISFRPQSLAWLPAWENSRCGARDMREFIAQLHELGIFTIARITVFQDPFHAERFPNLAVKRADGVTVWKDHKGLSFIDVAAQEYWDHIIELSVESYNFGFDELNFDYVRYPSDGNMRDISYPHSAASKYGEDKPANLEAFFVYLSEAMNDESRFATVRHEGTGREVAVPWTSADLFGMTTTNYDDLSIGQVQERAVPYFDFIAPMVYPSHYPHNYLGLGDPNKHPYTIVHHAMKSGVNRLLATTTSVNAFTHQRIGTSTPAVYQKPVYEASHLRTWIQDFNYGGTYGPAEVRAQIQASYDAGVMDFMIWAPSNRYTKAALEPFYKPASSSVD
ncbi:MAG: putative glycoside hydrolase [Candidatus Paceibacteria bacterium]